MTLPHGLMFHRFHALGTRPLGQGSLTDTHLEAILTGVGVERIVPPQEWLERVRVGALEEGQVCVTFDDGLRSQYEVALPVLDAYGVKAFWFVFSSVFEGGVDRNEVYSRFASTRFPSFEAFAQRFCEFHRVDSSVFQSRQYRAYAESLGAVAPFYGEWDLKYRFVRKSMPRSEFEQSMDAFVEAEGEQLEGLAAGLWLVDEHLRRLVATGHVVGLHSYDHPFEFGKLSATEQTRQYERNADHITRATGQRPQCVSHPLNSYSHDSLVILQEMGVICGFRANLVAPPGKEVNPTPLELARADAATLVTRRT